jgi:transcriptional regulator with XRE-family HTH domain
LREIAKRLGISRNTVRRYLRSETTEPAYAERQSAIAIDPYAFQLSGWLKTEAAKSRKQRRSLRQLHEDLSELGFGGSYDRVAAFARQWREGQTEWVNSARKRTNARRAAGAWQDLVKHPRASELVLPWACCAGKHLPAPCEAELIAIFKASNGRREQREAWKLAQTFWFSSLESRLVAQVMSTYGDFEVRRAAVRCAYLAPSPALGICFQIASAQPAYFVRLIVDIYDAMVPDEYQQLREVLGKIGAQALEIFDAMVMRDCATLQLKSEAKSLLVAAIETDCAHVTSAIARLMFQACDRSFDNVRRWMQAAVDPDDATAAVAASITVGGEEGVRMALGHPRAGAREAALVYLAASASVPLTPELLYLANDPGHRVRSALLRMLKDKPHPDHFPVLMALTMDHWDNSIPRYNESPSYPIARQAVQTLDDYSDLPDETGYALIRLATTSKDYLLKREALQCAVGKCDLRIQEAVLEIVRSHPTDDMRYIAADALSNSRNLAGTVLEGISRMRLDGHTSRLALSMVRLISKQLDIDTVIQRLKQLDRAAAAQVCRLLGPDHLVWRLLNAPDTKLPRSSLDGLGDVRLRQAILTRMNKLFERN